MSCRKCRGRILRHVEGRSRQYRCFNCGVTTFLDGDPTPSVPSAVPPSQLFSTVHSQLPDRFKLHDLLHYLWSRDNEAWTLHRLHNTLRDHGYRLGSWQGVAFVQRPGAETPTTAPAAVSTPA